MSFANIAAVLMSASTASGSTASTGTSSGIMIAILLFFVVYIFIISRREKKQKAEEQTMRESIKVGDEVLTIGGVIGRVVSVKEDSFILETGSDRNKIRFTKQAIATNMTAQARVDAEKNEAKAAKEASKKNKKNKEDK